MLLLEGGDGSWAGKANRCLPVGKAQDYDLASYTALPAQAEHADQRALAFGLLDYISCCKFISDLRLLLLFFLSSCSLFLGEGRGWGLVFPGSGFPHGSQNIVQLLPLPLGTDVHPHPFLDELEGPFVLGHLQ